MFHATITSLVARKLRLLTTSLAVLLGVAFMAGTLVLSDTIGRSFDGLFADANAGTSAVIRGEVALDSGVAGTQRPRLDAGLVDAVARVDGVAVVEGEVEGYAQLVGKDGKTIGNPNMGAPVIGATWLTDDGLNPFTLAEGRAPSGDHEVVIDRGSAKKGELVLGDTTTVLTKVGPQPVDVVGIATYGDTDSPGGASFTMFTPSAAQAVLGEPGRLDAIRVVARPGVSDDEVVTRIRGVLPAKTEVLSGAALTAESQAQAKENLGFFNAFLLTFAVIALFVGAFIIYNSFSVLVAQRTKEMAMLRAVGASRRQVLGSVLVESVAVGLVASIAGLVAGIGVAVGLKAGLSGMGIDLPAGSVVVTGGTVLAALVAGLGVSVASAVIPARRAAKVAPIAAMRDVAVDSSGSSRRRFVAGLATTGLGVAAMAHGLYNGGGVGPVGVGAAAVFIGVAVLGPLLARPLSWLIGAPLPRLKGMAGTLARENAIRNPKRTATTAAALTIGVTLVIFITVLASSTKASLSEKVQGGASGDLIVSSGGSAVGGLSPEVAHRLQELPQLEAVSPVRIAPIAIDGEGTAVLAVDGRTLPEVAQLGVTDGRLSDLGTSQLAVSKKLAETKGLHLGDRVPVRFAETGDQSFEVAAIYTGSDLFGDQLIGLPAYDANIPVALDFQLLISVADGVSTADAKAAVETVTDAHPQATVMDRDELVGEQATKVDAALNMVYALLALAVIIALLGIANTLALSIFERTRELGLLRAVGMSRRQVRATVRWEAVIIAAIGTTLGLVVGIGFGWAMVRALAEKGLGTLQLPIGQLAVVVGVALAAGAGAAILPARRAARLDVLSAIGSD